MCVKKICIFCKYCFYDPGCVDWSDVTPGDQAELGCVRGHWLLSGYDITSGVYAEAIFSGQDCPDFEARDDPRVREYLGIVEV